MKRPEVVVGRSFRNSRDTSSPLIPRGHKTSAKVDAAYDFLSKTFTFEARKAKIE